MAGVLKEHGLGPATHHQALNGEVDDAWDVHAAAVAFASKVNLAEPDAHVVGGQAHPPLRGAADFAGEDAGQGCPLELVGTFVDVIGESPVAVSHNAGV